MGIDRLEKIMSQDHCYGGALPLYNCQYYPDAGEYIVLEKKKIKLKIAKSAFLFLHETSFDKPSDIDKSIYQACLLASRRLFGGMKKMKKNGYLGDKFIMDLYHKIDPWDNGFILFGLGGYSFTKFHVAVKELRYSHLSKKALFSKVIPSDVVIITGAPEDVGIINGSADIDEWQLRNFFMIPGHVLAFRV